MLAAALVPMGCAHSLRMRGGEIGRVEAALAQYSKLVLAMDHAGIAALFAPEGEIVNQGAAPVHGREAIAAFLAGFSNFHVLESSIVASSTALADQTAVQLGSYHQKVKTPDGSEVEVWGKFRAEWVRGTDGKWLIARMATKPGPPPPPPPAPTSAPPTPPTPPPPPGGDVRISS